MKKQLTSAFFLERNNLSYLCSGPFRSLTFRSLQVPYVQVTELVPFHPFPFKPPPNHAVHYFCGHSNTDNKGTRGNESEALINSQILILVWPDLVSVHLITREVVLVTKTDFIKYLS